MPLPPGNDLVPAAQYADDTNLAARQAIYAYQDPPVALAPWVLDRADLTGSETVLDVGTGNGLYPAELARRGHGGSVVALDLSAGMLTATRARAPGAHVGRADGAALPLQSGFADVVLSMHVLYHVHPRPLAIAELRRVLRPGGVALVGTNSVTHLAELDALIGEGVAAVGGPTDGPIERHFRHFTLESAEPELRESFDSVTRYDAVSQLVVTQAAPIVAYARSLSGFLEIGPAARDAALVEVERRAADVIERSGAFRVHTATGCFVCH